MSSTTLIVADVNWDKNERGIQPFEIYESDGTTRRNGAGPPVKAYKLYIWNPTTVAYTVNGVALTANDAALGKWDYSVAAAATATAGTYKGMIIEEEGTANELHTKIFNVIVGGGKP